MFGYCRIIDLDEVVPLVFFLLKKVFSASSYGRTKVRIEFWSQCRILRVWTLVNRPNDVEYRRIPLNTVEYRRIPYNAVVEYRWIPLNTVEYRWIPSSTVEYRRRVPSSSTVEYRWIPLNPVENSCRNLTIKSILKMWKKRKKVSMFGLKHQSEQFYPDSFQTTIQYWTRTTLI